MKIIIINRPVIALLLSITVITIILTGVYKDSQQSVYKDREQWERLGDIVWEANIDEKAVAFTFDDGPSPTFTHKILDLLAKYNAKGSFFVIGQQAQIYPDIIKREYREGHEIGNHTYNHYEVTRLSGMELEKDLALAHKAIYDITRVKMRLFRPTSGYYDKKIVRVAKSFNYRVVIWTWGQDSRDWTNISGEKIALQIMKTIRPGSIVLFHDRGGDHSNTVKALEILLPVLKERGYQFVTVSTLLKIADKHRLKVIKKQN